jgi:hypothetical protein
LVGGLIAQMTKLEDITTTTTVATCVQEADCRPSACGRATCTNRVCEYIPGPGSCDPNGGKFPNTYCQCNRNLECVCSSSPPSTPLDWSTSTIANTAALISTSMQTSHQMSQLALSLTNLKLLAETASNASGSTSISIANSTNDDNVDKYDGLESWMIGIIAAGIGAVALALALVITGLLLRKRRVQPQNETYDQTMLASTRTSSSSFYSAAPHSRDLALTTAPSFTPTLAAEQYDSANIAGFSDL